jgi:hypothetical protein
VLPVQNLRIKLCSTCATLAASEDNLRRILAFDSKYDELSERSSFPNLENAQAKRIPAAGCAPFPHFHSDGYYYGLYPCFKTG